MDRFENRMASLLFKQAVELDMGLRTLADCVNLDEEYLRRCRENAAYVVERCGWTRIDCARGDTPRTIEDIHNEVMARVADLIG